jgi:hypothetical protein
MVGDGFFHQASILRKRILKLFLVLSYQQTNETPDIGDLLRQLSDGQLRGRSPEHYHHGLGLREYSGYE